MGQWSPGSGFSETTLFSPSWLDFQALEYCLSPKLLAVRLPVLRGERDLGFQEPVKCGYGVFGRRGYVLGNPVLPL